MSNEVKTKEKIDMDPKYIVKLTRGTAAGSGQRCDGRPHR